MKALFLIFHSFYAANGISKKIRYQIDAFKKRGCDIELCYVHEEENGHKQRKIDDQVICDYGYGIKAKLLKRLELTSISRYIIKNHITFIYIRYNHNANPLTIRLVQALKKSGVNIFLEIPTFPYDQEYIGFKKKVELLPDIIYRKKFMQYIDRIVTFSDEKIIFGRPTINISNGIDFDKIQLKKNISDQKKELHLIAVAEIHFWHGFDRLIKGLDIYYKKNPSYKIFFHLVGNFFSKREESEILPLLSKQQLASHVILHGPLQGEILDSLFELADIGIGSLARHRSGIHSIKTLKNREYAARGIPFIYSEFDTDFEHQSYIFKVPEDESPINIDDLIIFAHNTHIKPKDIRNSILHLSWERQIKSILDVIDK